MTLTNKNLALICLALVLSGYMLAIKNLPEKMPLDFRSFYFASQVFADGGNIYDFRDVNAAAKLLKGKPHVYPYLYPPPLAFYVLPLGEMEGRTAGRVWSYLCAAFAAASILISIMICKSLLKIPDSANTLLLFAAVVFAAILPFYNNLKMGQINVIVLLFVTSSVLMAMVHGKDILAGMLLAPAVLIKVTPVGFLIYFLIQKKYKAFLGLLLGSFLVIAPTLMAEHTGIVWGQFFEYLTATGYGKQIPGLFPASTVMNFSAAGWVARLGVEPRLISTSTLALLAVLGSVLIFVNRRAETPKEGAPLLLAYLVLMVIGAPFAYLHHVVFIYPGVLLVAMSLIRSGHRARFPLLVIVIALAYVVSIDFPIHYGRIGIEVAPFKSLNLYALLGLFAMSLVASLPSLSGSDTNEAASSERSEPEPDAGGRARVES